MGDRRCGPGGPEGSASPTRMSTKPAVCPPGGEVPSPSVGALFPDRLPSWLSSDPGPPPTAFLVAVHGCRYKGVLRSLLCLRQKQGFAPSSCGATAPTTHPSPPVVANCCGLAGLPPSEGKTVVLTIVDRFSKAAHFIPLGKLPSVLETANLVVIHVFRLHGIPVDILSDRGPQFAARTWKAFCQAFLRVPPADKWPDRTG